MARDDWYRSADWEPEDQAEFERRLSRSRPYNAGQYLRIKGLALAEAGRLHEARSLWRRVIDEPAYESQRGSALEHLADLASRDEPQEAEALYRRLLAENPTLDATTQMAEVRLAEVLIRDGSSDSLREAGELLEAWKTNRHSPFPANHFAWELARVRWGEATGQLDVMRDAARQALALTEAASPFPRHPGVGLVHAGPRTVEWLQARAAQ